MVIQNFWKQVYNSDQEINADVLTATSQIIEDYKNTQYYTKRGLNSGEYVFSSMMS